MTSSNDRRGQTPVIQVESLQVLYKQVCALDIPGLEVFPNERVFVLGKSGSGKTTFAKVVKSRVRPSTGRIRVLGQDFTRPDPRTKRAIQRRLAMIDQEFHLVPRMTVVANVLSGALGRVPTWRSLLGSYPAPEWEQAESILKEVELSGLGHRRVETLSGGQRQRVAIARALMQDADVILADEPVSNLDPELAEDALELLVKCTERRNVTLVVNLHQPRLARRFATRVIGLYQGRVVFDGPPEELSEHGEEFIYLGEDDADESESPATGKGIHDSSATAMA